MVNDLISNIPARFATDRDGKNGRKMAREAKTIAFFFAALMLTDVDDVIEVPTGGAYAGNTVRVG